MPISGNVAPTVSFMQRAITIVMPRALVPRHSRRFHGTGLVLRAPVASNPGLPRT